MRAADTDASRAEIRLMSCLRLPLRLAAGLALMALGACATVVRGPSETLRVESTPPGAEVQLSNGQSCEATPCAFSLPRSTDVTVSVSRAGCTPATVQVTSQFSRLGAAGMAGNAVIPTAGVVGLAVDGASGAARSLTPNPVRVRLRCPAPPQVTPASPQAAVEPKPASEAPPPQAVPPEAPPADAPVSEAAPAGPAAAAPAAPDDARMPPPAAPAEAETAPPGSAAPADAMPPT